MDKNPQRLMPCLFSEKFFMVTGGTGAIGSSDLDSTEIFSENVWKTVAGKLPVPMYDLRAATISNRVLIFGNHFVILLRNMFVLKYAFF